jgi:prepilin-type N-terminal cleavage/methylation domain-containing protein
MQRIEPTSSRGLTLIEMLIALAVGMIVIAAATQMFSRGLDATFLVTQRAQMQQDVRAAEDLMVKDISMSGAGLLPGGVPLASGTGNKPKYGCDQTKCYIGGGTTPAGSAFPGNYMYWIIPGPAKGVTLNAGRGPTDIITVIYADTAFLLSSYTATLDANGTHATFTIPSPAPPTAPQNVSDPAVGLKTGDLVLFTTQGAGGSLMAVGEVTADATGTAAPFVVNFANADSLFMNQIAATSGSLTNMASSVGQATRIWAITYYIDVVADPSGSGPGTPRLMRQVNGQSPVPVADNVSDLRITYDTYDNNGNLLVDQADAGVSAGVSLNMIRKVNVKHLTFRSAQRGIRGYQAMDISTSVSARNMSFKDRYQ